MIFIITRDPALPLRTVRCLSVKHGIAAVETNGVTMPMSVPHSEATPFDVERFLAPHLIQPAEGEKA